MSEERRKRARRRDVPGTGRYLTFSCYRRLQPLFGNDKIKARFVDGLGAAAERFGVRVIAWVVMPEHVHLIVFPRDDEPLTRFLNALKRPLAVEVTNRWKAAGAAILDHATDPGGAIRFWQPGGGHDRNVVGEEVIDKIRYIHDNPVSRGLAATPVDWPWSSARRYAARDDAIGPPIDFDLIPEHEVDLY